MQNFAYPYFSRDIAEFWRRWHISLSTWFRDYLYIPLGGSRGGTWMKVRNTFIIFVVSGFWHGANWTYIVWGALNAIYFLPLLLTKRNRQNMGVVDEDSYLPSLEEFGKMILTFGLTVIAWVFFRAENLGHAISYLRGMFSKSLLELPSYSGISFLKFFAPFFFFFLLMEWIGRHNKYAIEKLSLKYRIPRYLLYYSLMAAIFWFASESEDQEFIYFQF